MKNLYFSILSLFSCASSIYGEKKTNYLLNRNVETFNGSNPFTLTTISCLTYLNNLFGYVKTSNNTKDEVCFYPIINQNINYTNQNKLLC